MAIETIPVWTYEPNWSNTVTEALEWLTTILTSPTGAEQRRCNRRFPRRELEFTISVADGERTAADTTIMLHGGRTIYLPLWQEAYRLIAAAPAGSAALTVESADNGGIAPGDVIFIGSVTDALNYELVEVEGISENLITLVGTSTKQWPLYSRVHPVRKARLTDQPEFEPASDSLSTASCNFLIMEINDEHDQDDFDDFDTYGGFPVLRAESDWTQKPKRGFERMIDTYDNQVSLPIFRDTAGISFPTQTFHWINDGRAEYEQFRKLAYALAGRFKPVWMTTGLADLQMVSDTPAGAAYLTVKRFGYTANGGVASGRKTVCIAMRDGTRLYREITNATISADGNEVIVLNENFTNLLRLDAVLRISFMQLFRLNQDRLEIVHRTDTQGASLCSATFRAAPNLRVEKTGF